MEGGNGTNEIKRMRDKARVCYNDKNSLSR
jgi:hypothetical protein